MLIKVLLIMLLILFICLMIYEEVVVNCPKKSIVIINGSGKSGKDQFCDFIAEQYDVRVVSSARLPKEIATKYLGWKGSKSSRDRKMLSDLKDIMTDYNDIPYKDMCNEIDSFLHDRNQFLFIHVREPEEIKKLKNRYPMIKTLLILRSGNEKITSNHADANVENYDYDFIIRNDSSLETYRIKALRFARYLTNII